MRKFLKSWQAKVIAIVFLLLAAFVASSYVIGGNDSWIANAVGYVVTPLQSLSSSVTRSVSSFFGNLTRADELAQENDSLRQQVAELREQLDDYYETQRENTLYQYYLGLAEDNPDFEFCPAQVVTKTSADIYMGFVVNVGANAGVSLYDPVITDEGLVGYVTEVGDVFSRVTTLFSPDFKAGCSVSRTSDTGVLCGTQELAETGLCEMRYISRESLVAVGDLIVTTGMTGIFPRGLVIGTVEEIRQSAQGVSLTAEIRPSVHMEDFTAVFILTAFEGQGTSLESFASQEEIGNIHVGPEMEQ